MRTILIACALAFAPSAFGDVTCYFDAATPVAAFASDDPSAAVRSVVFCQRTGGVAGDTYIQVTEAGFPGDITTSVDLVFDNHLDATVWGPINQFVGLTKENALLSSDQLLVLRERLDSQTLEIARSAADGPLLKAVPVR